jgi:hypothetical protein
LLLSLLLLLRAANSTVRLWTNALPLLLLLLLLLLFLTAVQAALHMFVLMLLLVSRDPPCATRSDSRLQHGVRSAGAAAGGHRS